GLPCSPNRFSKIVQIAYDSAWHIFKKIATVIESEREFERDLVPTAAFMDIFFRRSRETPAGEHPSAEQRRFDQPVAQDTTEPQMSEAERAVYGLLSEEPISANDLGRSAGISVADLSVHLVGLEMAGLARRMPGDRFIRSEIAAASDTRNRNQWSRDTEHVIDQIVDFVEMVRKTFNGVSRKYVQKYLALYWSICQPQRWQPASLLKSCLKHGLVSKEQILNYVSPAQVKIWIR
ncbi:MAG: hypothetical protein ACRD3W_05625, partial [Terriglobales bacterium]